jgi:hypothetical protein
MIFVLSRGEFDTVSGKVKRFDKARQIVCQSAVFPMPISCQRDRARGHSQYQR